MEENQSHGFQKKTIANGGAEEIPVPVPNNFFVMRCLTLKVVLQNTDSIAVISCSMFLIF